MLSGSSPSIPVVISPDHEVIALQGMLRGLENYKTKNLSESQLAIVIAVKLCIKAFKINPTAAQIAHASGQQPGASLDAEITELVNQRYLHECPPKAFGKPIPTYRLGSTGGSALRRWVRPPKRS